MRILNVVRDDNNENVMKNVFTLSTLIVFCLILASLTLSCATINSEGGVGGIVIDSPPKFLEATIAGKVVYGEKGLSGVALEVKGYNIYGKTDEDGSFRLAFKGTVRIGVNRIRVQVKATKDGFRGRTVGVYVSTNETSNMVISLLPIS